MFNIDKIIRVYNITMVMLNIYLAYELLANTIGHYNWICEPVDQTMNQRSMRIASAIYLYWFSKLIDLLDSVFFILRGKYNQGQRLHQLCSLCHSLIELKWGLQMEPHNKYSISQGLSIFQKKSAHLMSHATACSSHFCIFITMAQCPLLSGLVRTLPPVVTASLLLPRETIHYHKQYFGDS